MGKFEDISISILCSGYFVLLKVNVWYFSLSNDTADCNKSAGWQNLEKLINVQDGIRLRKLDFWELL